MKHIPYYLVAGLMMAVGCGNNNNKAGSEAHDMSTQRLMQVMTTKDTTTIVTPMTMKATATTLTTNMLTSRA